jgi:putative transposase
MSITKELSAQIGISSACRSLSFPRATFYRSREPSQQPRMRAPRASRRPSPRALTEPERAEILSVLHSQEFGDRAPAAVHAALLDQGRYLCSPRTMYRLLAEHGEVRERRNQLTHPHYQPPELLATAPNQVWSWDITKLRGSVKWTYYYLYVVLDIYSRYVVGWMVARRETAELARQLLLESFLKQSISSDQLTIHSDRGSPMTSKPVALLLEDLGVTRSLNRPHVSNDNPFSESHFKTLKYSPEFPDRFPSLEFARSFSDRFFSWYNREHCHSGIAMLSPETVHYGRAQDAIAARRFVLEEAYRCHPERFVRKPPEPLPLPAAVWINPPADPVQTTESARDIQSTATLNSCGHLSQNC